MIVSLLLTGNLYLESSNFKILWLNQQLESQRNDWNIEHQPRMRHLADLLFFDEQYELSERWYRRALDIDPQDPYVLNNLSWLLSQVHEKDEYLLAESIRLVEKPCKKKRQRLSGTPRPRSTGNQGKLMRQRMPLKMHCCWQKKERVYLTIRVLNIITDN